MHRTVDLQAPAAQREPAAAREPAALRTLAALRELLRRSGSGTGEALLLWLSTRAALMVFSLLTTWLLGLTRGPRAWQAGTPLTGPSRWVLERFTWWDSFHFLRIADVGYLPPGLTCCDQAFLPGYPLTMAAFGPLFGGNLALAGLVISVVASSVAAVALWHLAERVVGVGTGRTAVLLLAVTPYGFFLTAVYSEALFLALALTAWLAGLHRRWWLAGVLAALATGVRINGLFLALGLAVMLLAQLRADGGWPFRRAGSDAGGRFAGWTASLRQALPLGLPALVHLAYTVYLWTLTGSMNAWQEAQQTGWGRHLAPPWTGLGGGLDALLKAREANTVVSRFADLFFALLGIVLVIVLLRLRRWAETAFMLPSVAVLVCSTTLISTPRYSVLWFPAFLLLAGAARTRPRLVPALMIVGVPWLALVALSFSSHQWTA